MKPCAVFVSWGLYLPLSFSCCNPVPHANIVSIFLCIVPSPPRPHYPFLSNRGFSTTFLPPHRGASVIGALSLFCQRAAGAGQGPLRAGFRPGCCPPICPSLRAPSRAHPAPAPPGSAGQRDAEVGTLTCSVSPSVNDTRTKISHFSPTHSEIPHIPY